jgi:prepilin-type N-terminal cleavage/methylation domain-containing protein
VKTPHAFTLVELLVVIAIMLAMAALLLPAFNGMTRAGDLTKAAYEIAATLDQARAYAIANNTYVFVGITEVDASVNSSASPQISGNGKNGRVAIAMAASRDGTRGYDVTSLNLATPPFSAASNPAIVKNGSTLVAISKLKYFDNLHLAAPGTLNGEGVSPNGDGSVGSGGIKRPYIDSNDFVLAAGSARSTNCVTQFSWPLGHALGTGQYQFATVINFDPQGLARIQYSDKQDAIGKYLEIGLIPTRGNVAPQPVPANIAVVQIEGVTGATCVYRP